MNEISTREVMLMRERCAGMLDAIAHPSVGERAKRAAKALLGRASAGAEDPLFWPAGFLLLGLVESARALPEGGEEALDAAEAYLRSWLVRDGVVRHVDDALAGCAALRLCRRKREGTGALLHYTPAQEARETAARVFAFLREAPRDPAGSLIYHPSAQNRCVYADGAGMAAVFLAEYHTAALCGGIEDISGAREAYALAVKQLTNYERYGMDARTGLPYHGYLLDAPADDARVEKHGLVGWGRAAGFLAMGYAACLASPVQEASSALREGFERLRESVLRAQRADGGFSWLLTAPEGHIDTSASAMLAYAFDLREDAWLDGRVNDGRLADSLAECVDFGQHPQRYGVYPWGMGAGLLMLSARKGGTI